MSKPAEELHFECPPGETAASEPTREQIKIVIAIEKAIEDEIEKRRGRTA